MNNNPKRHHYLPEMYLERFCREGLLWVYDREKNEFRQQTPHNTALEGHFYTAVGPDGQKHVEIEKFLSVIEGKAKPVITKVDRGEAINAEEKEILATFVSFLKVRVPDFEKTVDEANEKMLKQVNQALFSSTERTADLIKQYESDTGKKLDISPESLMSFVKEGQYSLKWDREQYLSTMMEIGQKTIGYFLNMDWLFLRAPSAAAFVTSDSPFVLMPPVGHDPNGIYGVGILSHGAKKIIPLSQQTCLAMCDRGEKIIFGSVSREMVRKINLGIAHECDRFLIGRDKELLERLVKTTNIDKWKVEERVRVN